MDEPREIVPPEHPQLPHTRRSPEELRVIACPQPFSTDRRELAVKVYPLGGSRDSTVFVDAYDKPFDATIPYDASFFELLNRFVQAEPWLTRDKVMIDLLKTIGIEKDKPYKADEKTKRILDEAVKEAHEVIALKYQRGFVPPFWEGTHWGLPIPKETVDGLGSMFADPNEYGVDGRAMMYHKKAEADPTPRPSPGWTKALPPGPDARVKITEAYAKHVGSDAYFWAWPMVNIYNRRLHFAPVKEAARVGPLIEPPA